MRHGSFESVPMLEASLRTAIDAAANLYCRACAAVSAPSRPVDVLGLTTYDESRNIRFNCIWLPYVYMFVVF